MGQLHKTLKKLNPLSYVAPKLYDTLHPLGTQAEAQFDSMNVSKKALKVAEAETPIPLPDDEAIQRDARRAASRKAGSGRASTFMSSDYGFGG